MGRQINPIVSKRKTSDISPDGYSRFFIIADSIAQIYAEEKRQINILDVGGASEFLEQELKHTGLNYELTILDIIEKPLGIATNYLQNDATKMNLVDNSYDVVVSTDTLEHVPDDRKTRFISECLRVAKELCIIGAPFSTLGVNEAESATNNFNKKLFGIGQNWLEEHFLYGKPSRELVAKLLERKKFVYEEFGTQNLNTWLINTHINLIDAKLGLDKTEHANINRYYNQNILEMDEFQEPTYRHFFIIYINPSKQGQIDINRYKKSNRNDAKTVRYFSKLMNLLADKIMLQYAQIDVLEKDLLDIKEHESRLLDSVQDLNETIGHQSNILRKLRFIIRLGDNQAVKVTYRIFKRAKGKND